MDIFKYGYYQGPNIGVFAAANDSVLLVPRGFAASKAERLAGYLGARPLHTSVAGTRLLGIMCVMNNRGILLPPTVSPDERDVISESTGLETAVLDTRYTALGNLVCANDAGAIISPELDAGASKQIQDTLGVEVLRRKVAGYHQVGAMIAATSHGAIVHPETAESDIASVSGVLHVGVEPATINAGVPYVSSGVLANNNAVVAGSRTTGPEIVMLTRAFMG